MSRAVARPPDPDKAMTTHTRSELILDEYNQAPQLMLIFPASRQTWRLRLTPEFARRLAEEVRPFARLRASRRRQRTRIPSRRRALISR